MVLLLLTRGIKGTTLYILISGFVVLLLGLAYPLLRWVGLSLLFFGIFLHLGACLRRKACNFCGARIRCDAEVCPFCGKWVAPCGDAARTPKRSPGGGNSTPGT